jgi:hypothetical protein
MSIAFPATVKTGQLKLHRRRFLFVHGWRARETLRAPMVLPGRTFTGGDR